MDRANDWRFNERNLGRLTLLSYEDIINIDRVAEKGAFVLNSETDGQRLCRGGQINCGGISYKPIVKK